MNKIVHQQQLTDTSCVPCCMSMMTGFFQGQAVEQRRIIDQMQEHGDSNGSLHAEFRQWVRMGYYPFLERWNEIRHGKIYLATVPSLNKVGGNHRIIVDMIEDMTIYDPNEGREDRLYYTPLMLRSWSELTLLEYVYRR